MAHFRICVVVGSTRPSTEPSQPLSLHHITTTTNTAMFDQLKHVIARPMTGKAPAEKHFGGMTPQSKLEKADPSTAFERSGWVYI
ncbi:uncharacterized protein IUM83_06982 [Phytophthora cinnamomi]|uniref:uncharacterized protein n=1 Tax=Phytophthora cinnamomi TaxID=4785 RepID=UPI00355A7C54|nr:hypothetical protein IUM83_06981 [Phytophthora cinnamomi]KAG6603035.1 hypothetical protein IUM83_06982 [Phytophthora cinnamomi]